MRKVGGVRGEYIDERGGERKREFRRKRKHVFEKFDKLTFSLDQHLV